MKYSIIIAVYNRLEEVKELLESAEKLEGDRRLFELLFVDDGSKDGFKEFIEQYRSASGLQIRAIYQQNQGPGAARNYGMSKAQGEYFIFVDSDCMFPPQWLAEIEKAQNEHYYDAEKYKDLPKARLYDQMISDSFGCYKGYAGVMQQYIFNYERNVVHGR